MITDAKWQQDLIAALHLDSLFDATQCGILSPIEAASIKPDKVATARAIANIRAWRTYLPEACVTAMINDGWQWST